MFKKTVILLVILSSLSFFSLIFIPSRLIKMLELIVPAMMLSLLFLFMVYDNSYRFKPKFRIEFGLMLLAVILSMFGAYYFHKQNFAVTASVQRFIYFLLLYPVLHVLKPKPEFLIKVIVYLGSLYAFLYILQTLFYPTKLLDVHVLADRETLRISIPGSGFLMLAYLIGLSRFIKTNNLKYLLLCVLTLIVIALLGSRQVIAPTALVTIISVLFSKKVKSRALIFILIGIAVVPVYFLFIDIFEAMIEVSKAQAANYQGDIRFKAARFFLVEFFPNKLSYIIGNGMASGLTPYGSKIKDYANVFGYYQDDIGIIGDYSKFGILMVIAEISLYTRAMILRLPVDLDFIKYNFFLSILTIFIGSSFGTPDFIVIVCISLYLIDTSAFISFSDTETTAADIPKEEQRVRIL